MDSIHLSLSMEILRNYSLLHLNTLGIDARATVYAQVQTIGEARELILNPEYKSMSKLVLGGGSNVLLSGDFDGLVIHNAIKGISILSDDEEHALIKAGAGENWHEFVCKALDMGLAGLENLSLIPGCVGASPIQNIGAYGVEIKDVFQELEALDLNDGSLKVFSKEDCQFSYRDSIFKREAKNKFMIVSVTYKLSKKPVLNTSYGAIEEELKAIAVTNPGIKDISQAVINIRKSKLPDPAEIGNAGSFFKNPEISLEEYEKLKATHSGIIAYKTTHNRMKLSAGWLIEQCGWKGKVCGRTGMHCKQALVLVNYGGASGNELLEHATTVQKSVKDKFGVLLEMEVNII